MCVCVCVCVVICCKSFPPFKYTDFVKCVRELPAALHLSSPM